MPVDHEAEQPADGPDLGFLADGRMSDRGPRYTETPADPTGPGAPPIAEPWNAVTAALFVAVAGWWGWRLRGRYARFPFLCCCLPILLAGGVGGTLYHATRASVVYFLLDVIPISLLGLAGSMYLAVRFWGRRGWWYLPALGLFYVGINRLFFVSLGTISVQLSVTLSYVALACVLLIPMGLVLVRTRFRSSGWVVAGLVAFGMAIFFRQVDRDIGPYLPMGSHWLWHTFGAITTAFVVEYFYCLEAER